MLIHLASAADRADIETLLDAAFGKDRKARTAYRLRAGLSPLPELSFVVRDDNGRLVGSLQCWPLSLSGDGKVHALTLLGPVAVSPDLQRSGLGKMLMTKALGIADAGGHNALLLIGDADYYGKFGFVADATAGWQVPGPVDRARLLARVAAGRMLPATGTLGPMIKPDMLAA